MVFPKNYFILIIYDIYKKMIGREENLMLNGNHRKAEEKHFEVLKNEELATVQGGGMSIFNDINHFFCDLTNCRGKGRIG